MILWKIMVKKTSTSFKSFIGTETDFFAGLRACQCLNGFHRTHMFKECHKCEHGLECKDDYATLKPGYWWKWRNDSYKDRSNWSWRVWVGERRKQCEWSKRGKGGGDQPIKMDFTAVSQDPFFNDYRVWGSLVAVIISIFLFVGFAIVNIDNKVENEKIQPVLSPAQKARLSEWDSVESSPMKVIQKKEVN